MDKIEIRLNNFLFNSGVLGFYKIIENVGKTELIEEIRKYVRGRYKSI